MKSMLSVYCWLLEGMVRILRVMPTIAIAIGRLFKRPDWYALGLYWSGFEERADVLSVCPSLRQKVLELADGTAELKVDPCGVYRLCSTVSGTRGDWLSPEEAGLSLDELASLSCVLDANVSHDALKGRYPAASRLAFVGTFRGVKQVGLIGRPGLLLEPAGPDSYRAWVFDDPMYRREAGFRVVVPRQ